MNDNECIEVFNELRQILEEQGLGWLVDAVLEEVHEGIIEEAADTDVPFEVRELVATKAPPKYRRSNRKTNFLVRREFSSRERLRLLVDAVQDVVSSANDIEIDMIEFFREDRVPKSFRFVMANLMDPRTEFSDEGSQVRLVAVKELQQLLEQLRKEIVE